MARKLTLVYHPTESRGLSRPDTAVKVHSPRPKLYVTVTFAIDTQLPTVGSLLGSHTLRYVTVKPCLHQIHIARIQVFFHLYPLSPSTCRPILYQRQNCRYSDMYLLVSGYKLLVWDTCIWLHVSSVNAALDNCSRSRKQENYTKKPSKLYGRRLEP